MADDILADGRGKGDGAVVVDGAAVASLARLGPSGWSKWSSRVGLSIGEDSHAKNEHAMGGERVSSREAR